MTQGSHPARTVILSDTHLGRPGCRARSAEALRPLWQGFDRLIINGDVAELADDALRVQAARHVMRIQQACEDDGVELTLLPGNHDPMISDTRYVELCGGEVFVTHGDALHPAISPWTSHRNQLRRFHDLTRTAPGSDPAPAPGSFATSPPLSRGGGYSRREHDPMLDATLAAAQYASHFTWDDRHWHPRAEPAGLSRWLPPPVRARAEYAVKVARVLWYWHTLPRRAARFAARYAPDARFFVFGHIHRAGVWRRGGQVIINTGSYDFPSRPHAVVIADGNLEVRRIVPDGDAFAYDSRRRARFTLRATPSRRRAA
jgi:predicted phosphodiesterase